jgi:hypothetical protein
MGMKRFKRAVAVTGEYTNNQGETKKQYQTVGTLMQYDDGGTALKLDALPLGDWNGWISFYDFDEDRKDNYAKGTEAARDAMAPATLAALDVFDDDIPF